MSDESFYNVNCEGAPKAIGPYSQAMMVSGVLFVSGQLGLCPKSLDIIGNDLESQVNQVIHTINKKCIVNLRAILKSCSMDLDCVAKVTVFLKDMEDYPKFNKVYENFFKSPYPARAVVQVSRLPKDALVEIEAVAVFRAPNIIREASS